MRNSSNPFLAISSLTIAVLCAGIMQATADPLPPGALAAAYAGEGLRATYLRCEHLVNPLGIDETQPQLSWQVESGERGQRQIAYRIVVASTEAALKADAGDLWDSGKVQSDETSSITYAGKQLPSGQRCFWKVKVWDLRGKESPWSEPAIWSMGLLKPVDWKAQWIGYDKPRQTIFFDAHLEGTKWIWFADDPQPNAPQGKRVFLATLELPADAQVEQAELLVSGDDTYAFELNGLRVAVTQADNQKPGCAKLVDIARFLQPGTNEFRATVENAAEGPAGLLAKVTAKTKDGKTYTRITDESWLASNKATANATNRSAWSACRVLGDYGMKPWGRLRAWPSAIYPAEYLQTTFKADKPVAHATVHVSAMGWADVYLNGKCVSEDRFTPGWTDYRKRIYYRTYDVTKLVQSGPNAFGAVLSDGWFSGYIGWYGRRDCWGTKPRFLGQLELEFADGSRQTIVSGPDWKATAGPITGADILMGERYDARKEIADWGNPKAKLRKWDKVDVGAELSSPLQAHPGPAVVEVATLRAKNITESNPGTYIFDMGQNFAGVPRLKLHGKPGQKITLRHAERLNPDGTLYVINLRSALATDIYTCKGESEETWSPRFTFHGFQYIEVTGLTEKPTADTVVGIALSSANPAAGEFTCSDPQVNQLVSNIRWTQLANFIDIPTDCPQRDERLGWTGDAQVYVRTASLNTDVQAFFTKWLIDLDDAQRADGQFPKVAPMPWNLDDGGPAWADAGVICPWTIYEVYGDKRLLARHYDSMRRFIEFCRSRSTSEGLPPEKYHCYGDWLSINADTPRDLVYTAYFAGSTKLVARAAEVLGKTDDAAKYNDLFEQIRRGFNKAYVAPDGRIKGDTQAAYVLALAFDLVQGDAAQKAAEHLVENIQSREGHLSTGFIGTKDLMLVLTKIDRFHLAYRILHKDTFPSWGFSIKQGATSIWERWDGWTPEKGFQNPQMNSFAHYSFGAVYQWIVENVGGIRNAVPGYKDIVIAPRIAGKIANAKVSYQSIHGVITSEWQRENDAFKLRVKVPANTTATIFLPAAESNTITESGKSVDEANGVKLIKREADHAEFAVRSGEYQFEAKARKRRVTE